jgi:hypothetical protein
LWQKHRRKVLGGAAERDGVLIWVSEWYLLHLERLILSERIGEDQTAGGRGNLRIGSGN